MKRAMVKDFAITGFLGLMALGCACAQDLPAVSMGPAREDFSLPTPPGVEAQHIGGAPTGSLLFNPPANIPNSLAFAPNVDVVNPLDSTSEGALQYSQGVSSPSSATSSMWSTSGFQITAALRSSPNSRFTSHTDLSLRNSLRFGQDSYGSRAAGPGTGNGLSSLPLADFTSGLGTHPLAGTDSMKSDIPDLTAPPGSSSLALPSDYGGGGPSMESSIKTPSLSYEKFGLSGESRSSLSKRRRSFNTLHERIAARSVGSTLRTRNAGRVHIRLRDR